jgi:hypothetical protein
MLYWSQLTERWVLPSGSTAPNAFPEDGTGEKAKPLVLIYELAALLYEPFPTSCS